jgi:hypothetical protein
MTAAKPWKSSRKFVDWDMGFRVLLLLTILTIPNDAFSCICAGEKFLSRGLQTSEDVFEVSILCPYDNPDIEHQLGLRLYLCRVHRYWRGIFADEYVMMATEAGSSCSIGFDDQRYIVSASTSAYGALPGRLDRLYFVHRCNVMESKHIELDEWNNHGHGTAIASEGRNSTTNEPCSEFGKIQVQLSYVEKMLEELLHEKEATSLAIATHRISVQCLVVTLLSMLIWATIRKLKFPVHLNARALCFTLAITCTVVGLLLYIGILENHSQTEVLEINDAVWMILAVSSVFFLLSLTSLAASFRQLRQKRLLTVLSFILLPFSFSMIIWVNFVLAKDGLEVMSTTSNLIISVSFLAFAAHSCHAFLKYPSK